MSDTKLRCCPFCGGEARLNYFGSGHIPYYQISCSECGCRQASSIHKESVINTWNTRKPIDRIVEQLENELELAEKQKEECTFKALPYYDRTEGYIVAMSNAINIVKGDDENE